MEMKNENFEKKMSYDCPLYKGVERCSDRISWATGYNTCLDRTNAKGIYEALKLSNCFPIISEKTAKEAEELAIKLGWKKNMSLENFAKIFSKEQLKKAEQWK